MGSGEVSTPTPQGGGGMSANSALKSITSFFGGGSAGKSSSSADKTVTNSEGNRHMKAPDSAGKPGQTNITSDERRQVIFALSLTL